MGQLVLIRHGQSAWNSSNRFTGTMDIDLTEQGVRQAQAAGEKILSSNLRFDHVFSSPLKRAYRTAEILLETSAFINGHLRGTEGWRLIKDDSLIERDYGKLTGMNKDEARAKYGKEQVETWRRSYDVAPPGGESLADVVARVGPYFDNNIRPLFDAGQVILVAAHENLLRALFVHLGENTPENIAARELATGEPLVINWPLRG